MLLNATHEITFSGLPPDILDAYVRYKKGTRAIVAWAVQYGPSSYQGVKTLPIKELASLMQTVSSKIEGIPDVIHFHFRETIAARKRLSKYFRGNIDESEDNVDTVNHEHFTTSLTQIYAHLCTACGRPETQLRSTSVNPEQGNISEQLKNHYESLPVEDTSENDDDNAAMQSSDCSECAPGTATSRVDQELDICLGDELGTTVEVASIMQRAQDLFTSIGRCWDRTGKGDVPFIAAAALTNVIRKSVDELETSLRELDETIDISTLYQKYCLRKSPDAEMMAENGTGTKTSAHSMLTSLQQTQRCLSHFKDGHRLSVIRSCASCIQKPADYIQSPATEDGMIAANLTMALLDNVIHLVTEKTIPPAIVRNGTPLYADIGYLLTHPQDETSSSMRSTFGLHLLSTSYKAFLQAASPPPEVSRCRITALRLAQQASSQAAMLLRDQTCFPCRCLQTLAFHLDSLRADLEGFAKHKRWDLYFQSPWVAGNHILEILDLCRYYGLQLFNYRHYVGAVLHSYNVLHQMAGLETLPLLEVLCEQFAEVLFPGGCRPTSSFRACWGRYVGARLKFKKGHKSRNSRDSWCMAIPAYAARRAAGLGLMDGASNDLKPECLTFRIKQQDYRIGDDLWEKILRSSTLSLAEGDDEETTITHDSGGSRRRRRPSTSASTSTFTTVTEAPSTDPLSHLANVITQSLTQSTSNPLPHARLNLFAVFSTCVRVVCALSDATHATEPTASTTTADPPKSRERSGANMNCICFASAILSGADRIVDARRRFGRVEAWKKGDERTCIETVKCVLRDVMAGVKDEDWLWDV